MKLRFKRLWKPYEDKRDFNDVPRHDRSRTLELLQRPRARAEPRPFTGSRVRRHSLSSRLTLCGDKIQAMSPSDITNKLWNYCHVLRDDGMSYGDYPGPSPGQADNKQLTYLLFLKMADERTQAPYNQASIVPQQYSWSSLIKKDGDALFDHYRHVLDALGKEKGLLGLIFKKAQNKFDSRHPWRSPFGRPSNVQNRSRRFCPQARPRRQP